MQLVQFLHLQGSPSRRREKLPLPPQVLPQVVLSVGTWGMGGLRPGAEGSEACRRATGGEEPPPGFHLPHVFMRWRVQLWGPEVTHIPLLLLPCSGMLSSTGTFQHRHRLLPLYRLTSGSAHHVHRLIHGAHKGRLLSWPPATLSQEERHL